LTRGDIPGWAEILARIEKVDRTGEHYGAADLEEEMANPEVVVGKDFVGAFDGPGMVGYFTMVMRLSSSHIVRADTSRPSSRLPR
jgi:hypothetical protein